MAFVTQKRYLHAFSPQGAMEGVGLSHRPGLWPQRTLARQIVDIVRVPRALDSASFGGGRIKLLEYKLEPGDPFVGKPLSERDLPDSALVVGSIRGESFIIPSGPTVLCPDDKVVFMGTVGSMRTVEARFAPKKRNLNVVIIGGGNVGLHGGRGPPGGARQHHHHRAGRGALREVGAAPGYPRRWCCAATGPIWSSWSKSASRTRTCSSP